MRLGCTKKTNKFVQHNICHNEVYSQEGNEWSEGSKISSLSKIPMKTGKCSFGSLNDCMFTDNSVAFHDDILQPQDT